jgi:hypothetical protein
MTHRLLICLSALAAAAFVAPGAWAAKPATEHFVLDDPFELAAGEVCSFDLQIDPNMQVRTSTFSNGRTLTNLRGTWQITNALTGESVSFHIGASGVDTPLPDGGFRSSIRGQLVLEYFPGDVLGPGLFLTKGHAVEIFDANGFITSSHLNGQRTDICALLS